MGTRREAGPDEMGVPRVGRDPGLPNELDVDPEMALGAEDGGAEPISGPIDDPEHQDYVEPASRAVPAPGEAGQ
jgi:hypothetical protein